MWGLGQSKGPSGKNALDGALLCGLLGCLPWRVGAVGNREEITYRPGPTLTRLDCARGVTAFLIASQSIGETGLW